MTVKVITDLFPANVQPRPPGVPVRGRIRAIVTEGDLFVAWADPTQPQGVAHTQVPVPRMSPAVNHNGGEVGPYMVTRASGCSCGSQKLRAWDPRTLLHQQQPAPVTTYP
jgi:hypothetical protein